MVTVVEKWRQTGTVSRMFVGKKLQEIPSEQDLFSILQHNAAGYQREYILITKGGRQLVHGHS